MIPLPSKAEFAAAHRPAGLRSNQLNHAWNVWSSIHDLGYDLATVAKNASGRAEFRWQHTQHAACRVSAVEGRHSWDHQITDGTFWYSRPRSIRNVAWAVLPSCPPDRLARLANVKTATVREAVARHPHTPPGTLEQIAVEDSDARVAHVALTHPALPDHVRVAAVLARR